VPTPSPLPRRTQDERRTTTRAALLDATLACLVELGYARTTTTEVTRRAGVSQGALFKHFASKSALVAAAAEELFATLFERFGAAFAADAGRDEPVIVALRRLWDVFCHPSLRAVYALYAEAPADDDLRATLRPVVERHVQHLTAFAEALFPQIGESAELRALFDSVLFAMQGASLQRPIHVDRAREDAMLAYFERAVRAHFAAAPAPRKPTKRAR
jgi:AcrR family transcriptional regulator